MKTLTLKTAFDMFVYLSSDQTVALTSWLRALKNNLDIDSLQNILMKISHIITNPTAKQLLVETMSENMNMAFDILELISEMNFQKKVALNYLGE